MNFSAIETIRAWRSAKALGCEQLLQFGHAMASLLP